MTGYANNNSVMDGLSMADGKRSSVQFNFDSVACLNERPPVVSKEQLSKIG